MKISNELKKRAADTVRCLCADMIEKANSGHPGAPLGMADLACELWLRHLNVDPKDPAWAGRDRLVFSGGHASALVYALFHLSGMGNLTLDELKTFRQFGSRCAGHPERGLTPGVEVTTGPLGQGIAMGVGLALAAKRAGAPNRTWVFCGDGDLEEGISHEAASWAGAMGVENLILVYDSNHITIEGDTALALNDDVKRRFESYGWQVFACDGHDYDQIDRVYRRAEKTAGKPVLIVATTQIGKGAPTKAGTCDSHGAPLGAEEVAGLKRALGFNPEESFAVPEDVAELFRFRTLQQHRYANKMKKEGPQPAEWTVADRAALLAALPSVSAEKPVATRAACGNVLNALAPLVPGLVGGSADLGPSNKTVLKGLGDIAKGDVAGRNIHFGIRELAMTAIVNGYTAFGNGARAYGATFFVFSDYCRPAIRLAALMKLPALYIFSHDSYCVGEDGPTHEPIEQLAALRLMPGVETWRPADATETGYAFVEALTRTAGPTCVVTTRQNIPVLEGVDAAGVAAGGYVIYETKDLAMKVQPSGLLERTVLFIATGSEVSLALAAAKRLEADGTRVRVVSLPCVERFLAQDPVYRDKVIPPAMTKRVLVEAGVRAGLDRFRAVDATTRYATLDRFGASAPYAVLADRFGFTADAVYGTAKSLG